MQRESVLRICFSAVTILIRKEKGISLQTKDCTAFINQLCVTINYFFPHKNIVTKQIMDFLLLNNSEMQIDGEFE